MTQFQGKVRGFTILELLVTLSIITIVSAIAVPRLGDLLDSFNKRNAKMQLLEDMRLAQATTVEQGCHGIFNIDLDQKGYAFGCDYVPYSDQTPPIRDSTKFVRSLPNGVTLSTDDLIMFNSRGEAIDETENLVNRSLTLTVNEGTELTTYLTGTLRATGFFSFD